MKWIRRASLAALLSLGLVTSGCLGPNRAFNKLNDWNSELTDSKWLNELAFIGLNIIPVYGVAYLVDIVVFNSMEFWGADNPMD